jgi:DNA ligase-1
MHIESAATEKNKVELLEKYFAEVSTAELAWSLFFLSGKRCKAELKVAQLRRWVQEFAHIDDWLFDECYSDVGDLCETIALLLQENNNGIEMQARDASLDSWMEHIKTEIFGSTEEVQRIFVVQSWQTLCDASRVIFNKILTGTIRSPVELQVLIEALSQFTKLDRRLLAQRLSGDWEPNEEFIERLLDINSDSSTHPLSFAKAKRIAFEQIPRRDSPEDWLIDWNWDGIRAQLIRRGEHLSLWSDDDQLLGTQFPELIHEAKALPDNTILEGLILGWKDADVLPFEMLKQRLSRKNISTKLKEEIPVVFMALDLLEKAGTDLGQEPFEKRRALLADVLSKRSQIPDAQTFQQLQLFAPCKIQLSNVLRTSPPLEANSWEQIDQLRKSSRRVNADGLILRKRNAAYCAENSFLICNAEPLTVNAVLVAAQSAAENRKRIFDDYTFAIWKDDELLPFVRTRADLVENENLGLTINEIKSIDSFVRKNTLERFGPVCTVKPELVFELSCRAIQSSQRNKAGLTVRFPRIVRMQTNKSAAEADTLDKVLQLIQ